MNEALKTCVWIFGACVLGTSILFLLVLMARGPGGSALSERMERDQQKLDLYYERSRNRQLLADLAATKEELSEADRLVQELRATNAAGLKILPELPTGPVPGVGGGR